MKLIYNKINTITKILLLSLMIFFNISCNNHYKKNVAQKISSLSILDNLISNFEKQKKLIPNTPPNFKKLEFNENKGKKLTKLIEYIDSEILDCVYDDSENDSVKEQVDETDIVDSDNEISFLNDNILRQHEKNEEFKRKSSEILNILKNYNINCNKLYNYNSCSQNTLLCLVLEKIKKYPYLEIFVDIFNQIFEKQKILANKQGANENPFIIAVSIKPEKMDIIKKLIKSEAKLDNFEFYEDSPLYVAMKNRNYKVSRSLLQKKTEITVPSSFLDYDDSPLFRAIKKKQNNIVISILNILKNKLSNRGIIDYIEDSYLYAKKYTNQKIVDYIRWNFFFDDKEEYKKNKAQILKHNKKVNCYIQRVLKKIANLDKTEFLIANKLKINSLISLDDFLEEKTYKVIKKLGEGGSKIFYEINDGNAIAIPNRLNSALWNRIVKEELMINKYLNLAGIPIQDYIPVFLHSYNKQKYLSFRTMSFKKYLNSGCYIFIPQSSLVWPKIDKTQFKFIEKENLSDLNKWKKILSHILDDLNKVMKLGKIFIGGDSLNMIIIKNGHQWNQSRNNKYIIRLFPFDFSDKTCAVNLPLEPANNFDKLLQIKKVLNIIIDAELTTHDKENFNKTFGLDEEYKIIKNKIFPSLVKWAYEYIKQSLK